MTDVARLGLVVETRGAKEATRELTELEAAAAKAADQAGNLGKKSEDLGDGLDEASEQSGGFAATIGELAAGFFTGAKAVQAFDAVVASYVNVVQTGIEESKNYETALFGVTNMIATMGNTSGLTVTELKELAEQISKTALLADDKILEVEKTILRFGKVSGEQFKQVTQLAVDMAARMGTDPVQAAELLGKALNNAGGGAEVLHRTLVELDPTLTLQLKQLKETGTQAEYVAGAIKLLSAKFAGASNQGDTLEAATKKAELAQRDYYRQLAESSGGILVFKNAATEANDKYTRWTDALKNSDGTWDTINTQIQIATEYIARWTFQTNQAIIAEEILRQKAATPIVRPEVRNVVPGDDGAGIILNIERSAAWASKVVADNKAVADAKAGLEVVEGKLRAEMNATTAASKLSTDARAQANAATEAELKYKRSVLDAGLPVTEAVKASAAAYGAEARAAEAARQASDRYAASLRSGTSARESDAKAKRAALDALEAWVRKSEEDVRVAGRSRIATEQSAAAFRMQEIALKAGLDPLDKEIQKKIELVNANIRLKTSLSFVAEIRRANEELKMEAKAADLSGAAHENLIEKLRLEALIRDQEIDPAIAKTMEAYQKENETIRLVMESKEKDAELMRQSVSDLTSFFESIIDGSEKVIPALEKLLLKMIEVYLQALLMQSLGLDGGSGGFLGMLFGMSSGGVTGGGFQDAGTPIGGDIGFAASGQVYPMARGAKQGRMVGAPTMRDMALMGEQGAEAVMPLVRDNQGNLALRGGGNDDKMPKVLVQNIDQRKGGAPLETSTSRGQNGEMQIRTYIRDEVKRAVSDGSMDKDFSKNFNLNRNPTRRS